MHCCWCPRKIRERPTERQRINYNRNSSLMRYGHVEIFINCFHDTLNILYIYMYSVSDIKITKIKPVRSITNVINSFAECAGPSVEASSKIWTDIRPINRATRAIDYANTLANISRRSRAGIAASRFIYSCRVSKEKAAKIVTWRSHSLSLSVNFFYEYISERSGKL